MLFDAQEPIFYAVESREFKKEGYNPRMPQLDNYEQVRSRYKSGMWRIKGQWYSIFVRKDLSEQGRVDAFEKAIEMNS